MQTKKITDEDRYQFLKNKFEVDTDTEDNFLGLDKYAILTLKNEVINFPYHLRFSDIDDIIDHLIKQDQQEYET